MRFQVTAEHSPLRCEICHQADCFDPSTGQCTRCIDVSLMQVFVGGRKFEPRGVWQDVRWLIWFLVIGMSVWGGIYQQWKWSRVSTAYVPEPFEMKEFESPAMLPPGILKRDDGVIRAWNLNGGANPFLHEGGVSYTPALDFSGKVVSFTPPNEFRQGEILIEEVPGKRLSLGIPCFFDHDVNKRFLLEEAFQPGRFISGECELVILFNCGNMSQSEWIRTRDEWENLPHRAFFIHLDSFESTGFQLSNPKAGNLATVRALPVAPAMPPRDRTGPYFIAERTEAISGLCGGYDAFPIRTFTGQIVTVQRKSQPKTNYLISFMTEERGRIRICTDLRAVAAPPVTWERFEKMLQPGNQAKLNVRVVYGGVFVLDSIGNVTR